MPRRRGDDDDPSPESIAAEVHRNTWWAYFGPLPEDPYVRAVIEVVVGRFWEHDPSDDLPRRPVRHAYVNSGDTDWRDFVTEVADRFSNMSEEEFQRLVNEGVLIRLS